MSKPRAKHGYGIILFNVSDKYKEERTLANVLNWLGRHFESLKEQAIIPQIKQLEKIREKFNQAERIEMFGIISFIGMIVSDFKRGIELLNPKGKKTGILNPVQVERLNKLNDSEQSGGGISPFTVVQTLYGVGKELYKQFEKGELPSHEGKELFQVALLTDKEILKVAEKRNKEYMKRQAEKDSKTEKESGKDTGSSDSMIVEHEEVGEVTAESILNGETPLKDVENIDLLNEAYQLAESSGKKAAITRQKNKIEA